MAMAKSLVIFGLLAFSFALTCCNATTYTVGDNSGWDISSDLDTWAQSKKFIVGDVLQFLYSSSHSVNELDKDSYEGCNTTNVIQSSSTGNTSYTLTSPGDRYFVCGNRLHCYAGMKLHVLVEANQAAVPASAPQAGSGAALPNTPSSKKNDPSSVSPNSAMFNRAGFDSIFIAFLGFIATLSWLM